MTTEPSSATNVDQLHDSFEENLTSFGVQYGFLIPVSERVIPLPMGIDEREAKSALISYNATMRLRGRNNAASLVERIVTRWEPPEEPKPTKAALRRTVGLMDALAASVNEAKALRPVREAQQLTVENNPLGSALFQRPE